MTLPKLDEALEANIHAALVRPTDALAESPGQFDNAVKHLERARRLNPALFSQPQLFLAEIHLLRGEKRDR